MSHKSPGESLYNPDSQLIGVMVFYFIFALMSLSVVDISAKHLMIAQEIRVVKKNLAMLSSVIIGSSSTRTIIIPTKRERMPIVRIIPAIVLRVFSAPFEIGFDAESMSFSSGKYLQISH